MRTSYKLLSSVFTLMFVSSHQSFAAGYQNDSTSTSGLGNAYAGSVTGIHDASDVFFNPAVTAGIKQSQFIAGMTYVRLSTDSDGATGYFSNGTKVSGGDSGKIESNQYDPALYLAMPISNKTTFNLAVTSPYGLANKYHTDWAGRYRVIENDISSLNINPSLAYKLSDKISIGAGVVAQYYESTAIQAVRTSGADGISKLQGSDWGYGYNLGATYQVNDKLKFGIGYRSKIDHNLSGKIKVITPSSNLSSDFNSKTVTPESLTLGTAYKINQTVDVAYDFTWNRTSRLKSIVVTAHQNPDLSTEKNFDWHDDFHHSIGVNFKVSERTLIRTGFGYEKGAITDADRGPAIPGGGDRIILSLGFGKKLNDGWSIDGAYSHHIHTSSNVHITDSTATVPSFSAKYKFEDDLFSFAVKKDF